MADDLKRINGIGTRIEARLLEAGIDSYQKLAQSSAEDLAAIPGVNLGTARRIIEQTARFAAQEESGFQASLDTLLPICEKLIDEIQGLSSVVRDRDPENFPKKHQLQIEKEIERIFTSLKTIKSNLVEDMTRVGRRIAKADRRMSKLEGNEDPKNLRRGLKKVRKKLEKALEE